MRFINPSSMHSYPSSGIHSHPTQTGSLLGPMGASQFLPASQYGIPAQTYGLPAHRVPKIKDLTTLAQKLCRRFPNASWCRSNPKKKKGSSVNDVRVSITNPRTSNGGGGHGGGGHGGGGHGGGHHGGGHHGGRGRVAVFGGGWPYYGYNYWPYYYQQQQIVCERIPGDMECPDGTVVRRNADGTKTCCPTQNYGYGYGNYGGYRWW